MTTRDPDVSAHRWYLSALIATSFEKLIDDRLDPWPQEVLPVRVLSMFPSFRMKLKY